MPICGSVPGIVVSGRSDLRIPWRGSDWSSPTVYGRRGRSKTCDRVAFLDDLAGVHHADPVAHRADDAEVVGDEQDRGVGLGHERADKIEHARLDGRVQAGRRLVEDEQLRVGGQRHRDDHALLHAARQLVRVALEDPSGSAIWTRRRAASALSRACFALWPRTVNASMTCGPTWSTGQRRAGVLVDHRGVVGPEPASCSSFIRVMSSPATRIRPPVITALRGR